MAKRKPVKAANHMETNAEWKWIVAPILIVLVGSIILFYMYTFERNSTDTNIEYIRSFMTTNGKLNDFSNKLGMHDPKTDIKWYWQDGMITIEFGRIILDWEEEKFLDEQVQLDINSIGFTIDTQLRDGKKVLCLYWKGEEVPRYVKD